LADIIDRLHQLYLLSFCRSLRVVRPLCKRHGQAQCRRSIKARQTRR
jgi:hypothetical protein